jgi:hypothetical protein
MAMRTVGILFQSDGLELAGLLENFLKDRTQNVSIE